MNVQFPVSDDLGLQPIHRFMSKKLVSIIEHSSIESAIKMMQTHKISGLPVVDSNGKVIGSYSEWDAVIQGASHKLSEQIQFKKPPIVAHADQAFRLVVALLIKTKVKRVFVVDKYNLLVGIVTRSDILNHILNDYQKEKDKRK